MCKFLLPVFAFLILAVSAPAQSQSEMNQEASENLAKADNALNQTYQKALAEHADEPQFCSDLTEAQRAWLKFVEFHMKTKFPLKEGENPREVYGSIYTLDFCTEKTSLIEARTEQLKDL